MKNMNKKMLLGVSLAFSLSLVLVGCGNANGNVSNNAENSMNAAGNAVANTTENIKDNVDNVSKDAENDMREMNYSDIKISAEEAFDTFMELHPDAKVTEVDLDKETMEYQYVIEGYDQDNQYEVKINPVSGDVLSDDTEVMDVDDTEEDRIIEKDHLAKVENLIMMAQKEDGSDSELDEWTVSSEDGKIVMDIEIGMTEYSYDVETESLIESDM